MSDIKAKLALQPFRIPNYVLVEGAYKPRQEGFIDTPKFALADLDSEVLSALCDEFRRGVFAKAGKPDPMEVIDE